MTPKEKAKELVNIMTRPMPKNEDFYLYDDYYGDFNKYGKQCALIAVDELIKSHLWLNTTHEKEPSIRCKTYWQQVKKEIEKL